MKVTANVVEVALALLDAPSERHWGYDLSKATALKSGVLYPILSRMLEEGWLADGWEDPEDAFRGRRPPRRYYTITAHGLSQLGSFVREAATRESLKRRIPGVVRYA